MARSSSEVTVQLKIAADAGQAQSAIKSLGNAMQGLRLKPSQMDLSDTRSDIKRILEDLDKIGKEDSKGNRIINASELKQAQGMIQQLNKDTEHLRTIYNQLSNTSLKNLIPQEVISEIKTLNSELDKTVSKKSNIENALSVATKLIRSQGANNFNINDKDNQYAAELKRYLSEAKIPLKNLPTGNYDAFRKELKKLKQEADEAFQTVAQKISKLDGINLDPATAEVKDLYDALQKYENIHTDKAKDTVTQLGQELKAVESKASAFSKGISDSAIAMDDMFARKQQVDSLAQSLEHFFGIQNMINLFKRGVREAIQVVQELDKAMAATAVVTDFTVNDMWKQLPVYQEMANNLGVTIKDVYEASTLYYQQGLNTKQVMEVTNQTLQMARIAGIGAAEATDMMTAALRGFNMEVNEANAQKVNDIFSELAAITASDTKELGTALEKTASIANSAGMSIEVTTALLAQAIEATREAPENIGTAMKTIIARFQELKQNPLTISEVDGETVDFNKVDTALKTIGVDLVQDTENFTNLDKVLLEISDKWDGLTQTQRRYIATIVAGSRQQSRFIAMMGDNARLTELVSHAYDSAGAAARQYEKTQASLETAFNRVKNAWDAFLMGIANNQIIKAAAGFLENLINIGNTVFGVFGKLPGVFGTVTKSITQLIATIMGLKGAKLLVKGFFSGLGNSFKGGAGGFIGGFLDSFRLSLQNFRGNWGQGFFSRLFGGAANPKDYFAKIFNIGGARNKIAGNWFDRMTAAGYGYNPFSGEYIEEATGKIVKLEEVTAKVGPAAQTAAKGFKGFAKSIGVGGWITIAIAGLSVIIALVQKFYKTAKQKVEARDNLFQQYTEKLDDIKKSETTVKDLQEEFKSLATGVDNAGKNIGLSADQYSRYNEIVQQLVDINPSLIQGYTAEGNAIINKNAAIQDTIDLLEQQQQLEKAEFYSPTNVKTAFEGYEGDAQLIAKEQQKINSQFYSEAFSLENLPEELKPQETAYVDGEAVNGTVEIDWEAVDKDPNFYKRIAKIDQENGTHLYNYIQNLRAQNKQLDQIHAQQANYVRDYANYLGYNEQLSEELQSSFNAVLRSKVDQDLITAENIRSQISDAYQITQSMQDISVKSDAWGGQTRTYAEDLQYAIDAKNQWDKSLKDNSAVKEYNRQIDNIIADLEKMANAPTVSEEQKKAIKSQIEILQDYKQEIFNVADAFNPLAAAMNKAKTVANDFLELSEGDDLYTAADKMAEVLDTILDTEVDDKGKITWGKNESGHGSHKYWMGADVVLGSKALQQLGYDFDKVDAKLKQWQTALKGGKEGYDAFVKQIQAKSKDLTSLLELEDGATVNEILSKIDPSKLEKVADLLGISEDSLAAMLSNARQFGNIDFTNVDFLKESYWNAEEGVIRVGSDTKNGKILVNYADYFSEYTKAGYDPRNIQKSLDKFEAKGGYVLKLPTDGGTWKQIGETLAKTYSLTTDNKAEADILIDELIKGGYSQQDTHDIITAMQKQGLVGDMSDEDIWTTIGESAIDAFHDPVSQIDQNIGTIVDILTTMANNEGELTEEQKTQIDESLTKTKEEVNKLEFTGNPDQDEKTFEALGRYEDELQSQEDLIIKVAEKQGKTTKDLEKGEDELSKLYQDVHSTKEEIKSKKDEFDPEEIEKKRQQQKNIENIKNKNKDRNIQEEHQTERDLRGFQSHWRDDKWEEGKDNRGSLRANERDSNLSSVGIAQLDISKWLKNNDIISKEGQKLNEAVYESKAKLDGSNFFSVAAEAKEQLTNFDGEIAYANLKINVGASTDSTFTDVFNRITAMARAFKDAKGGHITEAKGQNNRVPGHPSFAQGKSYAGGKSQLALTGELGPEIVWSPSEGTYYITGINGPEFQNIKKDDVVYTAKQSKKIAKKHPEALRGALSKGQNVGKSFAKGSSSEKKEDNEKYGETISKIFNELKRIERYERIQSVAASKYERLAVSRKYNEAPMAVMAKLVKDQRDSYESMNNILQGIVASNSKISEQLRSEFTTKLRAAGGSGSINDYVSVDWQKKLIQVTTKGLSATGDVKGVVSDAVSAFEDWFGEVTNAEESIEKNVIAIRQLYRETMDALGEFYDEIRDGVVQFRQDAIDRLSQVNETISESNQEILDATKESIDLQRQNRENDKTRQSLEDKRTRLSLLMQDTQGGHQVEIANLQQELNDETQNFQDTLVDQKLDAIEKANEKAQEQRERQITLLQRQLDWSQDTGKIWQEIYDLYDRAFNEKGEYQVNSAADKYTKYGLGRHKENKARRAGIDDDVGQAAINSEAYYKARFGTMAERVQAGSNLGGLDLGGQVGLRINGQDATGRIKKDNNGYYVEYNAGGSIVKIREEGLTQLESGRYEVPKKNIAKAVQDLYGTDHASAIQNIKERIAYTFAKQTGGWAVFNGNSKGLDAKVKELLGIDGFYAWYQSTGGADVWKKQKLEELSLGVIRKQIKNGAFGSYKTGGLADFTGPAWLDGTPSKPEMVLNQTDTQNFIQLKDILASIMKYNGLKSDSINSTSSGDTNYEININVDHLNSDYDVDKVAARVTKLITKSAAYRNPVKVTNYR